jgi:hypothetical protein
MFGLTKYPDWVKNYPKEDDREVLKTLIKNGADLSQPREMIFCVYGGNENAVSLQKDPELKDWNVTVTPSGDPEPEAGYEYFVEIRQDDYVVTPESLAKDQSLIEGIAEKHHAFYDGWYASV